MKTIFLTGASRGLGRAIGEVALAAGHRVVLTARDPASVADLVRATKRIVVSQTRQSAFSERRVSCDLRSLLEHVRTRAPR